MCSKIIHNFFKNNYISICLYCNQYLQPEYKIIKYKYYCCGKVNIYDNMIICENCFRILDYKYILNYLDIFNFKKRQIYNKKFYIYKTIKYYDQKFNCKISENQKNMILIFINKIRDFENKYNIKKLNIKFTIKMIYIDFFHINLAKNIILNNTFKMLKDYYKKWDIIKYHVKF